MAIDEARQYLEAGEFPKGSMGPKVEAAIRFLERGGQEVLITTPAARDDDRGETGTRINRIRFRRAHRQGRRRRRDALSQGGTV